MTVCQTGCWVSEHLADGASDTQADSPALARVTYPPATLQRGFPCSRAAKHQLTTPPPHPTATPDWFYRVWMAYDSKVLLLSSLKGNRPHVSKATPALHYYNCPGWGARWELLVWEQQWGEWTTRSSYCVWDQIKNGWLCCTSDSGSVMCICVLNICWTHTYKTQHL